MKKIKVFEAFAGIGTQRMALNRSNIPHEIIGISEIDKFAIQSYEAIHGSTKNYGDISKINTKELPDFDLFTYSFPCQDLSIAGNQRGLIRGQTRSGLLYECEKIIEEKQPKYLLLENVKQLVGKKFFPQFEEWLIYLESLGYTNYWKVLNSKDYGIPQNRERVFVISILNDEYKNYTFPQKQILNTYIKDIIETQVEDKYYLSKIIEYDNEKLDKNRYTICEIRCDEGIRFFKNNICGTLRTIDSCGNKYVIEGINNCRIRKLTPKECWRLMGISDDDFEKAKASGLSNAQLYKQAGNAIVVNVLEEIFKNLFKD